MNPNQVIAAWHFLPSDRRLNHGDGRLAIAGETLSVEGPIRLCSFGLHACFNLLDAISYAPGTFVCRVEVWGDVRQWDDMCCGRHRKVLWMADASARLRQFAIECAERVLHIFEFSYPNDPRPRIAIEAAKGFLRGDVKAVDVEAASFAAKIAASGAVWSVASAAADAAAWATAWVTKPTDRCAANAASAASAAAARAINVDVAAEREWQAKRLGELLMGLAPEEYHTNA